MQSLSSSQWVIIAILIVLAVGASSLFTRAISNRRPKERSITAPVGGGAGAAGERSGFKGWLILFAVVVFLMPILSAYRLINNLQPDNNPLAAELHYMFDGDMIIQLALIVLEICTIVVMLRRKKSFVPFYIVTAVCIILLVPVQLAWISGYSSWHEGNRGRGFAGYYENLLSNTDAIPRTVITAILTGIWIAYVLRSRRVANTFVR